MLQITGIDLSLDSAISRLYVIFFEHVLQFFMICCLAAYINSLFQLQMFFLQEWLLYTQLLEIDIFVGNDQV